MREMVRRISYEDHADKWLYFNNVRNYGVEYGPIFSRRIIDKWFERGEVVGHRVRGNFEEWFID